MERPGFERGPVCVQSRRKDWLHGPTDDFHPLMTRASIGFAAAVLFLLCLAFVPRWAAAADIADLTATIKRVGPKGEGHRDAAEAIKRLQLAGADALMPILGAMDDANPLAVNWLRGAFETIAERELKADSLSADALERFVRDTKHGDQSRRLAYDWLVKLDAKTPERLLPMMLDDPSLELRYDALARRLAEINDREQKGAGKDVVAAEYREALTHARDLDQIKQITEKLKAFNVPIDLAAHYGFVLQWKVIGPFENTDKRGLATVYPPEERVDFDQQHAGKQAELKWVDNTSSDATGVVDLNKALGKQMGAVAYAAAVFESEERRPVDLRLSTPNASKLWLNGKLLSEREVYHTGFEIDQYVGRGELKSGKNLILVKICQNEQMEDWAQTWAFRLRVCDSRGTAVLATNRNATDSAASGK